MANVVKKLPCGHEVILFNNLQLAYINGVYFCHFRVKSNVGCFLKTLIVMLKSLRYFPAANTQQSLIVVNLLMDTDALVFATNCCAMMGTHAAKLAGKIAVNVMYKFNAY